MDNNNNNNNNRKRKKKNQRTFASVIMSLNFSKIIIFKEINCRDKENEIAFPELHNS